MVCAVQMKYDELGSMMDERLKRHWAACEALALGYGAGQSHQTLTPTASASTASNGFSFQRTLAEPRMAAKMATATAPAQA